MLVLCMGVICVMRVCVCVGRKFVIRWVLWLCGCYAFVLLKPKY